MLTLSAVINSQIGVLTSGRKKCDGEGKCQSCEVLHQVGLSNSVIELIMQLQVKTKQTDLPEIVINCISMGIEIGLAYDKQRAAAEAKTDELSDKCTCRFLGDIQDNMLCEVHRP